ncbi:MAG: sulfite exporter TauE/SafE family protein [Planctomycetaceae bacterium]|nr:sulfite exporter TauE/SafE family protein [Planctomycetaceae bacterium]
MNSVFFELPLIFLSGILGSAHCIGMCGAICATMNLGTHTVRAALGRQLFWSAGRVFTYSFLGMVAGFAGARLSRAEFLRSQSSLVAIQAGFAILAGVLLVVQGMLAAGWFPRRRGTASAAPCVTASVFSRFLKAGSFSGAFVAGILTGFLPCGLVYSFIALAVASTSLWKGPLIMLSFGLGTVPVMLLTGAGLTMTSLNLRRRLMKAAAVCVLVTGVLTVSRGIAFASASGKTDELPECPFCAEKQAR